ncbi:MAG: metallophosphoesterase [Steroidobacteraceae bacterium]
MQLVQKLEGGPIDVIGDIHGEREALEALLGRLGYDARGRHPHGRRLVFVGDLCDRGPDSPGTIRLVQSLVESGRAHALAGNHELNLLRREPKHGNHWFFGASSDPEFGECVAISAGEQASILEFLRSLPLVLERDDVRIVHAAWIDAVVDRCRGLNLSLEAAYQEFDAAMRSSPVFRALQARHDEQVRRLGAALKDRARVASATAIGPYDEFCQMANPIRVITSGVERATNTPFFAAGKWRFVDRAAWWREYPGDTPVLFGHYWRWWNASLHRVLSKGEPHLFADDPVGPSMTEQHRAFCVDFSAGARWKQRQLGHEPPFHGRLAAMRWPERVLVFDAEASSPNMSIESLAKEPVH